MTDHNPYNPPSARLDLPPNNADIALAAHPKTVNAGRGAAWFGEGWDLFKKSPPLWIGMVVVYVVILIGISVVPLVSLLSSLFGPVFTAGFMVACRTLDRGEHMQFGQMFAGFSQRTGALVGVGALYLLGLLAAFLAAVLVVLGANADVLISLMTGADPDTEKLAELSTDFLLAILVATALAVPVIMAMWFAPALVMLHGTGAVEAMKLSFVGCAKNVLPFLVYGVVGLVLAIVATLPILLGWLVLAPVLVGSMYSAYKDIYLESQSRHLQT